MHCRVHGWWHGLPRDRVLMRSIHAGSRLSSVGGEQDRRLTVLRLGRCDRRPPLRRAPRDPAKRGIDLMARKFQTLIDKMPPERRAEYQRNVKMLRAQMRVDDMRLRWAARARVTNSKHLRAISRLIRHKSHASNNEPIYSSRQYAAIRRSARRSAWIVATFPDGAMIRIENFAELHPRKPRPRAARRPGKERKKEERQGRMNHPRKFREFSRCFRNWVPPKRANSLWALKGSNLRTSDYESSCSTAELRALLHEHPYHTAHGAVVVSEPHARS